jgi:uncharacterized membrane protein (GlpM family)
MTHDSVKLIIAFCAFLVASFLAIASLFIPPSGVIDSSALWAVAQFLVMCCTILGIDVEFKKFVAKIDHARNK